MKTLPLIAAALAASVAVAPVQAETISVEVSTAGLDLASTTGVSALAERIESNVSRACARANNIRDLKSVVQCKDDLLTGSASQLAAIVADQG